MLSVCVILHVYVCLCLCQCARMGQEKGQRDTLEVE